MIRIVRVTNPIDPSRDQRVTELAPETTDFLTLEECLDCARFRWSEVDIQRWAETVRVSLNGHYWPPSIWPEITPRDGDTIVIAPVVQGGSLIRTLATIAIAAAAAAVTAGASLGATVTLFGATFGFSGGLGAVAAGIIGSAVTVGGNLLVSALTGPSTPSQKTVSASYDPDGPVSLARSGVVIPKGYGTFRWGGNIISSYTTIAGTDVFFNVLVCFGYGPARSISSLQINGKDITSYQNVQYYTRLGANDQTEIADFNQISNGYPQQTQCLALQTVTVPGTGDLTQALQVDIQFPDGVFVDTNDGNLIPAVITYNVSYAVSGTNAWQPVLTPLTTTPVIAQTANGQAYLPYAWGVLATDLDPNSGVVYYMDNGPHNPGDPWTGTQTVTTYQTTGEHSDSQKACAGEWQLLDINQSYVAVVTWAGGYQDFVGCDRSPLYNRTNIYGLAPNKYDVQVTKIGSARLHDDVSPGDNDSPNIGQDMWVHEINEITRLDLAYPNLILVGVKALATSQLSGSNLNVTAVIQHGLRSRDEGLLPAALMAYEEDNPACVAADMMCDDLYGGGAWPGIQAANLDRYIDEWIAWAENNDTLVPDGNGNSIRLCVYNGISDSEGSLQDALNLVAGMSRAAIVPMGLDYGVSLDVAVDAPVQLFTMGSVLQDSFTEKWLGVDERANQVEIQFADATRYWRQDNPLVYMDPAEQDAGVPVKNTRVSGKGITSPAQAWHHARFKQRSNELLLRSGSFRTATAGLACRTFSVVAMQHDVPGQGIGGRLLPGSTAQRLVLDRDDAAIAPGTATSVMVLHPAVTRFTGPVGAVSVSTSPAGFTVALAGWTNDIRVTRALFTPANGSGQMDCAVASSAAGSVVVQPPGSFVPLAGMSCVLADTDVLETQPVASVDPSGSVLLLSTPLSQAPEPFVPYLFGLTGAQRLVRVVSLKKSSEFRSTVEWIDYDAEVYDVATPVIGETSAVVTTRPGIASLTGTETFQKIGGSYVSFANLAWTNGPDTAGVGIYALTVGAPGLPKQVARLTGLATTWQAQQAPGTQVQYTVVGFDQGNTYAPFSTAPSATVSAVGVAANLLLGSNFASGFTYWNLTPRTGSGVTDALSWSTANDGQALYTVGGSTLTGYRAVFYQIVDPRKWAVGDLLMLSAYVSDTQASAATPNQGNMTPAICFVDGQGNQTYAGAPIAMNGSGAPRRTWTAVTAVPAGTVQILAWLGIDGINRDGSTSPFSIPPGSVLTGSHFLLEQATAGQTVPSTWADVDVNGQITDLFTTGSSSGLRAQGSVLPTFNVQLTYDSSDDSVTITWSNLAILWPDGMYQYPQDGSLTVTGLNAGLSYYAYPYFDIVNGGVAFAVPPSPEGVPGVLSNTASTVALAAASSDGRVNLTPNGFIITTASDSTAPGQGSSPDPNPLPPTGAPNPYTPVAN